MSTELTKYLRKVLDVHAYVLPLMVNLDLPFFLIDRYTFLRGNILDNKIVFILEKNTHSSISTIIKDIHTIERTYKLPIVIVHNTITRYRASKYIDERISYVVFGEQIYMPFIAIAYEEKRREKKVEQIKKFSPATQAVYLYFLYNNKKITAYNIAQHFSYSLMTASRALSDLCRLNLITFDLSGKTGRLKSYRRINDPDYFKSGRKFLVNPIRFIYQPRSKKNIANSMSAGLSALAKKTMLNPPNYEVRAVPPMQRMEIETTALDEDYMQFQMEIQIWKYDPRKLSETDMVDDVSLMLTLETEQNERVVDELKKLMRANKWYTD